MVSGLQFFLRVAPKFHNEKGMLQFRKEFKDDNALESIAK